MPKSAERRSRRRARDPFKPLPTHADMGRRYRAVARTTARRGVGRPLERPLPDRPGLKRDFFKRMLAEDAVRKLEARRVNAGYRAALGGQDELLSTASVRELMLGVLGEHRARPLTPAQIGEINAVIDTISKVRLPTAIVGYSLASGERMQHPTAAGTELFASAAATAATHSRHDRARRSVALEAAERELSRPGATFERVASAATTAAIAYTLNEMAAPITARDVKPFSRRAGVANAALRQELRAREAMKAALVLLGGTQEPGPPDQTDEELQERPWEQRRGQGLETASPPRTRSSSFADVAELLA